MLPGLPRVVDFWVQNKIRVREGNGQGCVCTYVCPSTTFRLRFENAFYIRIIAVCANRSPIVVPTYTLHAVNISVRFRILKNETYRKITRICPNQYPKKVRFGFLTKKWPNPNLQKSPRTFGPALQPTQTLPHCSIASICLPKNKRTQRHHHSQLSATAVQLWSIHRRRWHPTSSAYRFQGIAPWCQETPSYASRCLEDCLRESEPKIDLCNFYEEKNQLSGLTTPKTLLF